MKNMANKIINVLIVDDEQIVREGLRYIIDWNALGFCICGEAANGPVGATGVASGPAGATGSAGIAGASTGSA